MCSLNPTQGFYQIALTESSSRLCTMATPRGRYRYRRLPFGLRSAPEVVQRFMFELFGDLPGVHIYFDDVLVCGETEEECASNLRKVLEQRTQCQNASL